MIFKSFFSCAAGNCRLGISRFFLLSLALVFFSCHSTKVAVNWEEEVAGQAVIEEEPEPKKGKKIKEPNEKLPEGHIGSGKESKEFKHKEPVSIPAKMLRKLDGEWLPTAFFQEVEKKKSLLSISLFPPVPGILIKDGKVDILSAAGKKNSAIVSGKQNELQLTTKEDTYHFSLRGNELVWTAGRQKISYRRVKNNNRSFNTLVNNAMIAGTYFSMLTRTLITFKADGSITGMGSRYTNYRFPENQKELQRANGQFDLIFLYHKKRPSAGRWFALVWDERSKVRVIARVREIGNALQLSSNVYMLKNHGY